MTIIKSNFLVFAGGSGSGKSFQENKSLDYGYQKLVSHTTRKPRLNDNEVHGVNYFFVSDEEFEKIEFLEKVLFNDNKYGVSKKEIFDKNGDIVLVAESNGVKQIVDFYNNDKDMQENYELIIVLLNLPDEIRRDNMLNKRGDTYEFVEQRLASEDIVGDFRRLNLKADIEVTELCDVMKIVNNYVSNTINKDDKLVKEICNEL